MLENFRPFTLKKVKLDVINSCSSSWSLVTYLLRRDIERNMRGYAKVTRCHLVKKHFVYLLLVYKLLPQCSLAAKKLQRREELFDNFMSFSVDITAGKLSRYEVFSSPYFPVFGRNTGKYVPEKTPYWGTFYAVYVEYDTSVQKAIAYIWFKSTKKSGMFYQDNLFS